MQGLCQRNRQESRLHGFCAIVLYDSFDGDCGSFCEAVQFSTLVIQRGFLPSGKGPYPFTYTHDWVCNRGVLCLEILLERTTLLKNASQL